MGLFLMLMLAQSIANPLFVWNELFYQFEMFDLRGLIKGSIYLVSYLTAILAMFIFLKLKSKKLFISFLFLLFILVSIDFFVQLLGVHHGFSYAEYTLAMNETGNYKYLMAYSSSIVKALLYAFVFVLSLYFIRQKILKNHLDSRWALFVFLPLALTYGACYRMDTFKLSSYPAMIKIPDIAVSYLQFSEPIKERILAKEVKSNSNAKFKNIVWIIDESITGSYLSINGYEKKTTPYLDVLSKKSNDFTNFGIANSISNCSASSNLFLRIGVNPYHYEKEQISDLPTIFQYAKRAGYKTWLFDSQTREGHLQNHLSIYDKESIDNFKTLGSEVERPKRDKRFLDEMISLVNNVKTEDKNFIVMVKYGAHFPYLLTYEANKVPFAPTLEHSYDAMSFKNRDKQLNTYANSVYFNVDLYFKHMMRKIDLSKSIVFYTSDHGQNILEVKGVTRTHCNTGEIVKNEVSVPLFVFTQHAKTLFPKDKKGYYSHIQIFPTTLSLMGYDSTLVASYGKTLKKSYAQSSDRKYILSSSQEAKVYK